MKFTNTLFSRYSIEEHDELGRAIAEKLTNKLKNNKRISQIIAELNEGTKLTEKAIGTSAKKAYTKEIKAEDDLFNKYFKGFKNTVYGYANSPDANEAEASEVLRPILEKNDDQLYDRGYIEQGAKFNSLVADLKTPEATKALQTLNKTDWKEKMKTKIDLINGLIAKRDDTESQKDIPTDKDAKNHLKEIITDTLEELRTLHRRNVVENLKPALLEIDEVIKKLNAIARARQTRKGNNHNDEQE